MPSLTLDDRLIWFAHCPKAGGTSVEHFMVAVWGDAVGHLHWGWDRWWKRGGWRQADPPCSPQHLIWADACAKLSRAPDAVLAVVRDPLNRLISEYRYQRFERRGTRTGRLLARLPFSTWAMLMLRMAEKNPYIFDNHLRPQGDFIPAGAQVFRLEDGLQPALVWLAETAGVPAPVATPHALAGQPAKIKLYSEDIARITQAYAADYARFGYVRPDPGAYPADPIPRVHARLARALLPFAHALERRGRL